VISAALGEPSLSRCPRRSRRPVHRPRRPAYSYSLGCEPVRQAAAFSGSPFSWYKSASVSTIGGFQGAIDKLEHALQHHAEGDVMAHAKFACDQVLPAMAEVRRLGDSLETMVADDLWPLPTYREMLFIE